MKTQEFWQSLTGKQQFVTALVMFIVVILAIRYFNARAAALKKITQTSGELQVLSSIGVKPSYPSSAYQNYANKLEIAMSGMGTDETSIYSVFKAMKNDADLIMLDKAFGVRDESDLSQWLYDDLASSEISTINKILSFNGVTKLF